MTISQWESFAADCGLTAPLELAVSGPDQPRRRHTFAQPWVVIGRAEQATLRLAGDDVSRRHAYLQVLGGRLLAVDLESRSGLRLGGAASHSGWLDPGQPLGVGPFLVEREGTSGADSLPRDAVVDDPLEESSGAGQAVTASFDIVLGDRQLARWRMNRRVVLVGASARCRVRLRDPSVSRVHCSLVATGRGIWVVDLHSRRGTRLRGEPIEVARLADGDTVEVGNYCLRIHYHRSALPAPAGPPAAAPLVLRGGGPGLLAAQPGLPLVGEQNALFPLIQQFNVMQQQMFDQFQQTLMLLFQMMSSMHQEQAALIREELRHFKKATDELNRLQEEVRSQRAAPAPRGQALAEAAQTQPPRPWPSSQPQAAAGVPLVLPPLAPSQAPTGPAAESNGNVQEWLNQRIAELRTERQSSWQRILGFIRGD
jgi:pSer/pThr/pTyr-binding forkhead associated (FHA) protein